MPRRLVWLSVIALVCAGVSEGRECRQIDFPAQVQLNGTALTLNGLGVRKATVFKVNVYVAALYLTRTSTDPNAILDAGGPYELILHFVRDVDSSDINKGWAEGFARNHEADIPSLKDRITLLTQSTTDIKKGERVQFLFNPGAGLQITVNGAPKGTISGADFGKAFLAIWLGTPPNPELKAGLLGGACS
jgi:Chalcone isomerase-like